MATFLIKTFGCKTNQTESAVMEEKLLAAGFLAAENVETCNYYVFNSCAVTLEAEKKLLQTIKSVKHKNPNVKIILTGCYAQLHKDEENPLIDKIFGIYEKPDVVEIIKSNEKKFVTEINEHRDFRYEKLSNFNRTRATIKIQDGCNNRCSYCTICIARGLSRSCDEKNVLEQIDALTRNGYNEIVLTGIHVGQWGLDFPEKKNLLDLLKLIDKTDAKTVRIGSLDPNELTEELIDFLSSSEKFCPLRMSTPSAALLISVPGTLNSSAIFGINGTGRLSTQKYPISSSILSAVLFPAPDIPVTITHLILEFSQSLYFRLKPYSKLFIYLIRHLVHQIHHI